MWLCKRDLSKECEGKYKNCVDCVLDKIRAEIIELRSRQNVGVLECLDIIDKYKAESEVNADGKTEDT